MECVDLFHRRHDCRFFDDFRHCLWLVKKTESSPQVKTKLFYYWLAMNASAFQAAIHSAKAYMGIATAHAAIDAIPALNWQQACAVFATSFVVELINYADAHPLSDLIPVENQVAIPQPNAPSQPEQ